MNSVTDCAFGFSSYKDWQMRDEKIRYQLPIASISLDSTFEKHF
jgi:hypothetical protein